ncbi:MaoC/PaaZ C-terminal domain-containing protein [Aliiglaciecola sp. M165]|uniref:MaoC/PaaZ C-terminal domain-containing protein n=1 Tax=Aliiglaciecola sp. M165 TaxID=2593649 RepID=UPI00117E78EE|nr:MaoC/PaaZ C-terminal domain-containing protein [Aliiglaciecola sp. M165]TRY30849.1 hypothetical protein FM019_13275 [Aliiglaciecola sp. M165]
MNLSGPNFFLLRAALKRNKPWVFDSALLPRCETRAEDRISHFNLAHVSAFHHLTEWKSAQSNALHPCYLHMMSFKQHMRLMLNEAFPFALLGIVHLHNSIKQLRPIEPSDKGVLGSYFGDFKRHSKGITAQINSQYSVNNEVLWSSVSEFLAIDKRLKRSKKTEPVDGDELANNWLEKERFSCDHKTIRSYARVSGDFNPIHLSDWSARLFGFKSAIAHGMWSKARSLSQFQNLFAVPVHCHVSFNRPLFLPFSVRLIVKQGTIDSPAFKLVCNNHQSEHLIGKIQAIGKSR